MESKRIYSEWTGGYPNLCSGKWILKYDDKELEIPQNRINKTMETYKKWEWR